VRCLFEGSPSHPMLLAREIWDQLPRKGDAGARQLTALRLELVDDIIMASPAPADIDTPDDYGPRRVTAGFPQRPPCKDISPYTILR
jgi:CTP:molybdopterin cytidylyltransferase MocA